MTLLILLITYYVHIIVLLCMCVLPGRLNPFISISHTQQYSQMYAPKYTTCVWIEHNLKSIFSESHQFFFATLVYIEKVHV